MKIEPLRVQDARFSKRETACLYALAGATLMDAGKTKDEAKEIIAKESPANIVRLALGPEFPPRKRGGKRPNNGRRDCARCGRLWSGKVKALGEGLCGDCWHALADGKAAAI